MRNKIIQIAEILSQAAFMVVKIAFGDNKTKQVETEEQPIEDSPQCERLSEEETDNLTNIYLESLNKIGEFFCEWDERNDDDKHDEFLHYFYHLEEIIRKMEHYGMIVQCKDKDGTNIIDIPNLERGKNDN